ncbi:MAG: NitT/TauT family transport system permease protein [Bradyrhizobium sp.]|jgi:NitT/TauT family transport system permease protein|nr:NitT/TauT family transport system permease protein [Bradyrhizobium sp.]
MSLLTAMTAGVHPPKKLPEFLQGAWLRAKFFSLIVPIGLLVSWQLAVQYKLLPAAIIPAPSQVLESWIKWAFGSPSGNFNSYSGSWGSSVRASLWRVAQGYAIAVLIGVPTGVLIGRSQFVRRLIDPMIQGLRPVPITAWLPLAIAVFGIHDLSALALIGLGAFYPIVISTTQGARGVPQNLMRVGAMMGMNWWQSARMIVLPSAAPAIFTGLRLGLGIAWTALVVAEMVAVKSGLGFVLWDAYYIGRMDIVLGDMVSIGIIGLVSDQVLVAVEARILRWRTAHAS